MSMLKRTIVAILVPSSLAALMWSSGTARHDCSSCGGVWAQVHEQAKRSVVTVECIGPEDEGFQEVLTGVVIKPGLVATVALRPAGDAHALCIRDAEGQTHEAQWLGLDAATGVALLRVDRDAAPAIPIARGALRVGQPVLLVGNPYGLSLSGKVGHVAGLHRTVTVRQHVIRGLVQLSMPTHPGDSGAPVCNCEGQMVALLRSGMVEPRTGARVESIGFAIPAATVLAAVQRILDRPAERRSHLGPPGYLGIILAANDASEPGVRIARVVPSSPAARAGLRAGDIVLAVEGEPVRTPSCVAKALATSHAGKVVEVLVQRAGRRLRRSIRLRQRPERAPASNGTQAPEELVSLRRRVEQLEAELRTLKQQLSPARPARNARP